MTTITRGMISDKAIECLNLLAAEKENYWNTANLTTTADASYQDGGNLECAVNELKDAHMQTTDTLLDLLFFHLTGQWG